MLHLFYSESITEKKFSIIVKIRDQGLETPRHFSDRFDVRLDIDFIPFFLNRDDLCLFQLFDVRRNGRKRKTKMFRDGTDTRSDGIDLNTGLFFIQRTRSEE